ncbi:hypothetical protein GDO81_003576 [Engystomops pustulosus]|uniref:Uncharacterized protein n=1 Tax=Engystomops pustulosus TaxID=76066 RepID=A0AAV7A4I0_ENGPU|nr:hypothetical protein GDO81_003576 [Engystomops pustulosus]
MALTFQLNTFHLYDSFAFFVSTVPHPLYLLHSELVTYLTINKIQQTPQTDPKDPIVNDVYHLMDLAQKPCLKVFFPFSQTDLFLLLN